MTSPAPLPPPSDDRRDDTLHDRADVEPVAEMTFAEYLVFDESSQDRHEYVDGVVYAMGDGTSDHGVIATNVASYLRTAARGSACRVYTSMMRVATPRGDGYVPDVLVDCGPPPSKASLYREQPCLVVEVLSPSTRRIDVGEKAEQYRKIETLQAYWIVESTWRCVYRHWRDAAGTWQFEEIVGDGVIPVPCPVATSLTFDEIYEDVDVPGELPPPPLRRVREESPAYVAAAGER